MVTITSHYAAAGATTGESATPMKELLVTMSLKRESATPYHYAAVGVSATPSATMLLLAVPPLLIERSVTVRGII